MFYLMEVMLGKNPASKGSEASVLIVSIPSLDKLQDFREGM